jgi:predicted dehydrogenase
LKVSKVTSAISINSTTKELSGGGSLIDLGVHFIDLAVWLMGNPKPVAVTGATYTKFANNEISNSVHSRFGEKKEDGASLQIEFSGPPISLRMRTSSSSAAPKRAAICGMVCCSYTPKQQAH